MRGFNFTKRSFEPVSIEFHVLTLAIYVAVATVSFGSRTLAAVLLLSLTLAANVRSPILGLSIAVFVAPLQSLFGLYDTDFTILRYGAVLLAALSAVLYGRRDPVSRQPLTWVLLAFGIVLACHLAGANQRDVARELAWYAGIAAIYFASLYAGPRDFDRLLIAVYASVLVSGILSALYLYGGMTWLIDQRVTLYENLRLSGVQYNPNVLSKLAGVAVLSAALTFSRRPLVNACLLPVFSAVLYAAGSKAAILGVLVLMSFWIVWELRLSIKRALRVAGLLAAVLACMTVTHVAADRFAPSTADVQRLQMAHGTAPGFWSDEAKSLLRFFRIGTGYRMEVVDAADGSRHVDFQKVTGLAETGQRLDLWAAGLRIMKDNWLWGLGPEGLTEAMMREVDYPHTSPHNVILEMVDGYGLAGLALYALTLFFLFRAARRQWADGVSEPTIRVVTTTVAFFLIVELVEPSVAFAYGVVGLWFWHYAALLVALGPNADQKRTVQTSRVGFSL